LHLVPALAVHLVDQMLSRRQLQHVAFLLVYPLLGVRALHQRFLHSNG
jgi:hypothetical protein